MKQEKFKCESFIISAGSGILANCFALLNTVPP
jgi:hypothetical protein